MNLTLAPRWTSASLLLSSGGYIDCGNATVLSNLVNFTIEAWVNTSTLTGMQVITGNVDTAVGGQYQLFLSDGYVVAYVGMAPYVIQSPTPITANTWHHLAASYNGTTKTLTLYVDGVQSAQQVFTGTFPKNGANVLIGATLQQAAPTYFFNGEIGRVMIWNSVRQPEDILNDSVQVNIYKATENTDLVLCVDFSVLPAVDSSGNIIDLTFKNNPQFYLNVPSVVLGTNGYVNCGQYAEYSRPGKQPYTIEGWFFPTSNTNGTLISYGANGNWEYKVSYANNQVTGWRNSDTVQLQSNNAIVPLSYYHFALTYDDTVGALSLYINGNLQNVDYFPGSVTAVTNGQVLIGAEFNSNGQPTNFLNAAIQNIRIWNVCLEQSEISQWMYNDVVNDSRLISNFDFTVNPPIDSTDKAVLDLLNNAQQTVLQVSLPMTEPIIQLGLPQSLNAVYLNQNTETPTPPPTDIFFAPQPPLFSEKHKEESWTQFTAHFKGSGKQEETTIHREQFETAYGKAKQLMDENPKLKKVFTRTDEKGLTRIVHHGLKGDTMVYEGAIGAESDCTLWWIQFIFQLTVGFYQALGLLPTTGNIATRIYNLVRANQAVMNALMSLTGKTITATAAIGIMGVIYQQGLMWTIIKFVLTSAGWYALFWILRKVIAIVTGLEAAALLAGFIVWASQLTILSLNYNSQCGSKLQTAIA